MEKLADFWGLAARLKEERRRGWVQALGLSAVESVGDHSFGVAFLSLYEAERRGYKVEKALKMALVHDLDEAITGDLTPRDKRQRGESAVERDRARAVSKVVAKFPPQLRKNYSRLLEELRLGTSREARLVKNLDRLEMALQAKQYERKSGNSKLKKFYQSALNDMTDPYLKRIVRSLMTPARSR